MISADEILTAVFKVLDGDATLQASDYLNGTEKIIKGTFRPKNLQNPSITLKLGGTGIDTEIKLQDATVYVNVFADNYRNGAADLEKLAKIAKRVEALLDDAHLANPTGGKFFNCYLSAPQNGPYYDNEHPDEHYLTSVFRIQCIDLT